MNHALPKYSTLWNARVDINIRVIQLLAIHGSLCLALRHPENAGQSRELVEDAVRKFGGMLVEIGAMTPAQRDEAERAEGLQ